MDWCPATKVTHKTSASAFLQMVELSGLQCCGRDGVQLVGLAFSAPPCLFSTRRTCSRGVSLAQYWGAVAGLVGSEENRCSGEVEDDLPGLRFWHCF